MVARALSQIQYQLIDFVIWKRHFDDQEAARRIGGCLGHNLYRASEEQVSVQFFFVDPDEWERFFAEPDVIDGLEYQGGEMQETGHERIPEVEMTLIETIWYRPAAGWEIDVAALEAVSAWPELVFA